MMHLSAILEHYLLRFQPTVILETGSIRFDGVQYQSNDGWSTLTFAKYVSKYGGHFTSIDLNTTVANTVLRRHQLRDVVELVESDSLTYLATLDASLDFVYLDSDNNADLIFEEFQLVYPMMSSPGLVLVDDVNMNSASVTKGHKLLPYFGEQSLEFEIVQRSGSSYTTGVLVLEV